MKSKYYFILSCMLLMLLWITGCDRKEVDGGKSIEIKTIVLVTIDTWRWDANGFLGKMDPSPTPFLDSIAANAFVAENAWTPVPTTGPSHWSMLNGRWPWRDGLRVNGDKPNKNHDPTLVKILSRAGWCTAGFVSCRVLDHRVGFSEGFQHFDDHVSMSGALQWESMAERRGDHTIDVTIQWIKNSIDKGKKLFLWIHLFDPHFPYKPPAGGFNQENTKYGRYLGEILFADRQLQGFANWMEKMGRPVSKSLWVILSDHGEGFGDHGEETHGMILHGATTRIPLIISGPGINSERSPRLVSTVDVFPTILEYAGVNVNPRDGLNVFGPVGSASRSIPMEAMMGLRSYGLSEVTGIRHQNWLMEVSPLPHLWDIDKDPKERVDMGLEFPERITELKKLRRTFGKPDLKIDRADPSLTKDLQSLGYLPSSFNKGSGDVRKFLEIGGKLHLQVLTHQRQKEFYKAETAAKKFLKLYPNSPGMWQHAGFIAVQMKDFETAEKRFLKSIELNPANAAPYLNLGNIFFFKKRYTEAIDNYKKVLTIEPEDMYALYNLGLLYARIKRTDMAAGYWKQYLKLYPDHKNAMSVKLTLKKWEK